MAARLMNIGNDLIVVGAACTLVSVAAAGGAWVVTRVRRWLKRIDFFLNDFFGEPPRDGYPGRHGVMSRLETIEDNQRRTEKELAILRELKPNGGNSIKDQMNRMDPNFPPESPEEHS